MVQEYKNICIVGAGASGCVCAYYLIRKGYDVTLFDYGNPLRTILPTGGGRCNLAHAEFDNSELVKNYPRGEKFLHSIFSQFSTYDTLAFFEEIGIKTYIQENNRIFPESNSSKDVREIILKQIKKANIIKEKVVNVAKITNGFCVKTNLSEYLFSDVIVATGGHSGYDIAKNLGINIITPKPSLVGLKTKESFKEISGTFIKNVYCKEKGLFDDLLFTHFGISGPLIFKISSLNAFKDLPYEITLDLYPYELDLQVVLNTNPHKEIKNIIGEFVPQKFVPFILKEIKAETKAHSINGTTRDLILDRLHNYKFKITGTNIGEETVTAGGIDLDEINSKTMESKKIPHLYFIGEVLNIDGFCGGFNLQNAWSTAYVAANAI